MKKIIFIGGTMGVGKTTTSKALHNILQPSIWLDGDWCWQMNPWNFDESNKQMVIKNICYLLNNYLQNDNFRYIIFSWVMHKQEIINEILNNLNLQATQQYHISLVCSKETLEKRMKNDNRDVDSINTSLNRLSMYQQLDTTKINTDNQGVDGVANQIKKMII
ncbi:AAA family ATPase [Mycoplasmatota bacterium]|nr:AAA family ATPase [Mycoplasmatota bacterium]